jgi:hypothetical protein
MMKLRAALLAAAFAALCISDAGAQSLSIGGGGSGSSGAASVNGGNSILCSPTTGSVICSGTVTLNTQTGTSYPTVASDGGKLVTLNNASPVAVSLSQANQTGFTSGFGLEYQNLGAGLVTITPATSTINGAATLTLNQYDDVVVHSDGTNYYATKVSASAGGTPCSLTALSLQYNNAGAFGCVSGVTSNGTLMTFANSDLVMTGSSTGATTFTSDNAGASNFTIHVPAANDTLVTLAASQTLTTKTLTTPTINGAALSGTFSGAATLSGNDTFSAAGDLSSGVGPAVSVTGAPITGGSGTTTVPLVYCNGGTAPTTWSTSGTYLGCNAVSGFAGNFIDLHLNGGASLFSINSGGAITNASNISSNGNIKMNATGNFSANGRSQILMPADGTAALENNAGTSFTRLDFGGTTSSFFGLGISTTSVQLQAADGTATVYASCTALTTNAAGTVGCTASDPRLKDIDPSPYTPGLDGIVAAVHAGALITFRGKPNNVENIDTRRQAGFNCWKVRDALPMATHQDKRGYCNLDPEAMQAAEMNAIAQLQAEVIALQHQHPVSFWHWLFG